MSFDHAIVPYPGGTQQEAVSRKDGAGNGRMEYENFLKSFSDPRKWLLHNFLVMLPVMLISFRN